MTRAATVDPYSGPMARAAEAFQARDVERLREIEEALWLAVERYSEAYAVNGNVADQAMCREAKRCAGHVIKLIARMNKPSTDSV